MAFLNAFSVIGRALLLGGLVSAGVGLVLGGGARPAFLIIGLSLAPTGLIFSFIGSRLGKVSGLNKHLRAVGVVGTATIASIRETGVLVNNSPVLELGLDVDTSAHAPYQLTIRQRVPMHALGAVAPGTEVTVVVDPADRERLAIDFTGSIATPAPTPPMEDAAREIARPAVRDVERLLRVGRAATAVVISMRDAGDMSELGLVQVGEPGDDDRLFVIDMEVDQAGLDPYEVRVAHRVPERLVGRVGPRTRLKVAVDRGDDHAVAIDWSDLTR